MSTDALTPLEVLEFYEGSVETAVDREPFIVINAEDYATALAGMRQQAARIERLEGLLLECADELDENCETEGRLSSFVDLSRRIRAALEE